MLMLKLCMFACLVGSVYTFARGDLEKYGLFNLFLNSQLIKCDQNRTLDLNVNEIKIHFFNFARKFQKSFYIKKAAKGILGIRNLNRTKQFVMFVGGFTSHIDHEIEVQMRRAYLMDPDSYLIIPDHSLYTSNWRGNIKGYERAVTHSYYIGKALGKMMAQLSKGISPRNIHCVGHSLGGQILGHVGTTFSEITGKKIHRVTAMDPAGPCYAKSAVDEQVRSGVAEYVEVYHCNAGALGSSSMLGDIDFIVNKKGEMQPNCGTPFLPLIYGSSKAASCNHRMCVDLWTASVKYPQLFDAYSCESYENFKDGMCWDHEKTMAGAGNPGQATGIYYFSTENFDIKILM